MAERCRQAGGEERGSGRLKYTHTHINIQKYTQIDTHAETHRNIMYGNVCIHTEYKPADKTTSQHAHNTTIHIQIHNVL